MKRFVANLVYKRLETERCTALVIGVERFDMGHCLTVGENLKEMRPECVVSQVQSDHPMFISCKKKALKTWEEFVKGGGGSFLVKPRPECVQDMILSQEGIAKFLGGTLLNSKEFCYTSANLVYSKHPSFFSHIRKSPFQPDCFLTSLLYHANNPSSVSCSLVADLPELVYRDNIVRSTPLKTFHELFFSFFEELEHRNDNFDVRLLLPELMLRPKAAYLSETLKQLSNTHKLIAAVVDINLIPFIEEEWQKLKAPITELKEFVKIIEPIEACTMVEYAEKHVLLDLMLGLFVEDFFMKYKFFPYSGVGIMGSDQFLYDTVLRGWSYYYEIHGTNLKNHINALVSASHAGSKKGTSREKEGLKKKEKDEKSKTEEKKSKFEEESE